MLRPGPVERPRPDPEGTPLRADQPRGQPRRGRQGGLLLPRRHARRTVTCKASTNTLRPSSPTGSSATRTSAAAWPNPEFELTDTGRLRRRPLLGRLRRVRQGVPRRRAHPDHRRQPRARARPDCTCCRRSGSAIPGAGARPTTRAAGPSPGSTRLDGAVLADHETLGRFRLATRRAGPIVVFTENETNTAKLFGSAPEGTHFKDAFHDYLIGGRTDAVKRDGGTKAAAHLRPRRAGRRGARRPPPPDRRGRGVGRAVRRLRPDLRRPHRRGRRVLRREDPGGIAAGGAGREPAGLRGAAVERAVLPLRRARLGERRRQTAAAAGRAGPADQPRLAAPVQPRRALGAGQVGVPGVLRLGPGLPHGADGPRRSRASPRRSCCCCCASGTCTPTGNCRPSSTTCRNVNPPGPRLGLLGGVPPHGGGRPRLPGERVPQAAHELHLVGQPQGPRGPRRLLRRVPGAWTTSASSTARGRCRRAARSSRPTAPPGWAFTARACSASPSSWPATTAPTRTSPRSSSSTSWPSPTRSTTSAAAACGTRTTASTTTSS